MTTFGEILKKRREELSLNQDEVAKFIGKTKRTYQHYEDDIIPKRGIKIKLGEILKFDFLAKEDEKPGGSLSIEDMASKLIRIEAQQSVILGTQAEILAHLTDKSVPALLRQKANEVKTMEEELRSEL